MRTWVFRLAMAYLMMVSGTGLAAAEIVARINLANQTMTVLVNGAPAYVWRVSTARRGYETPRGSFRVQWLDEDHASSQYEDAPMPFSVFFKEGYAIHGSYETRWLGHPASHGCVRLSPHNAEIFFGLVQDEGLSHTRIVIN